MKLFEIKNMIKELSGEKIIQYAIDKGLIKKELGRGTFAVALELSNGQVVKAWYKDPAYEQFLDYCKKKKRNPFLPKVGEIKTLEIKDKTIKYARMEKLEMVKSLKDFGYNGTLKNEDYFFVKLQDHILDVADGEEVPILAVTPEFLEYHGLDSTACTTKFKKFLTAILLAASELVSDGLDLDLKMANFAKRGEQIVFMDPVVDETVDIIEMNINKVLE